MLNHVIININVINTKISFDLFARLNINNSKFYYILLIKR